MGPIVLFTPMGINDYKKYREIQHTASQQIMTGTAYYIVKDAETLIKQIDYKKEFATLKVAAEESSVPENIKIMIASDTVTNL